MASKAQRIIVCAPATGTDAVEGSVFTHKCMQCEQYVALAPSGQAGLRRHPDSLFLCLLCFHKRPAEPEDTHEVLPGAMEEFAEYLSRVQRGPTKQ